MKARTKQKMDQLPTGKKLTPSIVGDLYGLLEERGSAEKLRKDANAWLEKQKHRKNVRLGLSFDGYGNKIEWDLYGGLAEKIVRLLLEEKDKRIREIEKLVSPVVDFNAPPEPTTEDAATTEPVSAPSENTTVQ